MTIQTIAARLHHPQASAESQELYCFDSEEHGLVAEPFVHSATMAIHLALRWALGFDHFSRNDQYAMSEAVELRFTDSRDDLSQLLCNEDPVLELSLVGPESGGHSYSWVAMHPETALEGQFFEATLFGQPEAWLCPVLLDYFPDGAPEKLWVAISEQRGPAWPTAAPQKGAT
jgi:hypothetical protein